MSLNTDSAAPGDLLVWVQAQPPLAAYVPGEGPYLGLHIMLGPVAAEQVASLGLDGEESWFWGTDPATGSPPVAIPASMVVALVKAAAADLGAYWRQ